MKLKTSDSLTIYQPYQPLNLDGFQVHPHWPERVQDSAGPSRFDGSFP